MRRYLVLNDIMSTVSKSNKRETYQQKITNPLINERHVLVDSYLCTHISRLLNLGNVNECRTVLVKNLIKESFYGKRKKTINILTAFFISHKSDVKTFLK